MVAIATVCIHKVEKLGTPDNQIGDVDVMFLIDDHGEPSLSPLSFFFTLVTPDIIGAPLLPPAVMI